MDNHPRPNPDELLARVQEEEKHQARGKLKIFLGYAAGIGKTYAMLEAARARLADHVDVVIGYVETHKRAETEALVAGLEIIPRQSIEYHGVPFTEMDVDAILARKPQLALVDELAHTNAIGSRHPKRYLDVLELLAAGIAVYTTLNIQHLESLNDVVAQITGVIVRETIPDSVLDQADDIELIDLAPDDLIQRLKEGKVYVPEQAARAIEKFFRKGNLAALREIALRRTADRVDDQMRAYMETRAIAGPWAVKERLLVCVSPGALSERLIRTARRLADGLGAEWTAIYVETPNNANLSSKKRGRLERILHLAEELGAKTTTLPSDTVVETIIKYARAHNITKIIAGKPVRAPWIELVRGSVVDQLIRQSGDIDVYVISAEAEPAPVVETREWQPHRPLRRYLISLGLVAGATLLAAPLHGVIVPTNLVMLYLVVVVIAAIYLGRGPAILASILGVLALDFFFVPPSLTFAVSDTQYILTFVGLLIVGLVISALTARVREQAESARQRETQTAELYEFTRDLAATNGIEGILQAVITHVGQTVSWEIVILLPEGETLQSRAASPGFELSESEFAVATWAYQHNQSAGRGTDTLPAAAIHCRPLKTPRGAVGVLGVKPIKPIAYLTQGQVRLLELFGNQAALAIERVQLAEQARQTHLLHATEKLQTALLDSVSHELRTPLVSITGALSSLQEENSHLDADQRRNLIETALGESERLNHLVGNLLDMTRIEAGAVRIKREPCDVQDLLGAALDRVGEHLNDRNVTVDIAPALPLVPLDFGLIVQVLVNLLDNAIKYSFPDTAVEIGASVVGPDLQIRVADRGIGIPPGDLARVFEKFFRVHRSGTPARLVPIVQRTAKFDKYFRVQRPEKTAGTGLGLSICKGIVEVHGGAIKAENREGGVTVITITLPAAKEHSV
ncbi:MAG: sensor histidine kinase KdpD [Chloroflexi bacterium]|nr:sensor histidine kinase KdpD [Chloroflexota bacterium]